MKTLIAAFFRHAVQRRATARLLDLDEHLLNDIGLTRSGVRAQLRFGGDR